MKTTVYFENEGLSFYNNTLAIKQIRQDWRDDFLVVISSGVFSSCGEMLEPRCEIRAQEYVSAGADLVLTLPIASILGGFGKKEFAMAALAQRLHASEKIVIPCRPLPSQTPEACGAHLKELAMLMFKEENGYRHRLTENLNAEMPFREAQHRAVCACFPMAEDLLEFPENRYALWLLDAMLQLYYMTKVRFIDSESFAVADGEEHTKGSRCCKSLEARSDFASYGATGGGEHTWEPSCCKPQQAQSDFVSYGAAGGGEHTWEPSCCKPQQAQSDFVSYGAADGANPSLCKPLEAQSDFASYGAASNGKCSKIENPELQSFEHAAACKLNELLRGCSMSDLLAISGATEQMAAALLDHKEAIQHAKTLHEITQLLSPIAADKVRLFVLKAILGIQKIHMQICGLHTYAPYCHVSAVNSDKCDLYEELEKTSWVPFLWNDATVPREAEQFSYLLQADKKTLDLSGSSSFQSTGL